jgi:hypothetical protein
LVSIHRGIYCDGDSEFSNPWSYSQPRIQIGCDEKHLEDRYGIENVDLLLSLPVRFFFLRPDLFQMAQRQGYQRRDTIRSIYWVPNVGADGLQYLCNDTSAIFGRRSMVHLRFYTIYYFGNAGIGYLWKTDDTYYLTKPNDFSELRGVQVKIEERPFFFDFYISV